jgi:hypothetical protein
MRAKGKQQEEPIPSNKWIIQQKPDREAKTVPIRSYLKRELAKVATYITNGLQAMIRSDSNQLIIEPMMIQTEAMMLGIGV